MKRRIFSIVMAMVMVITTIAATAAFASAAATYNVTYSGNGGRGNTLSHRNVAEGSEIVLNQNKFKRALFIFVGWNDAVDEEGNPTGTMYQPGDTIVVNSNMKLYAIWEKEPTVRVFYEKNDPACGGNVGDNQEYVKGSEVVLQTSIGYNYPEHKFKGWNTAPDGSGDSYEGGQTIVLNDNLTLYAIWESLSIETISFPLTYDANGGEGVMIDENSPYVEGGLALIMENVFTREGYEFVSWNTAPDGSGETFYAYDMIMSVEKEYVLYAQWKNLNGEEVVSDTDVSDDTLPGTGSVSYVATAFAVGALALGAITLVSKKKQG